MRTISYGGESLLTSDAAADAVLQFAAAAALNDVAEVVHIPSIDERGGLFVADLVIGPASEIIVTPAESPFEEPDTNEIVSALAARTLELGTSGRTSRGAAVESVDTTEDYWADE